MIRMGNELTHATEEGSLYRPIKQDPEARIKMKRESQGLMIGANIKVEERAEKNEPEELE